MSDKAGVTINTQQQITYTKTEHSYVISRRDWNRIKKTIESLKLDLITWSNLAWGMLGLGSSCLLSWFTGPQYLWLIVVGCTTLGISVCAFIVAYCDRNKQKISIENLKDVLQDIEDAIISKETVD